MTGIAVMDGALVRLAGPETAPPLVFFHAFGDTGHCYQEVFSSDLSERYRLIAVDLWGFGASPARDDVRTLAEFSRALERFVLEISSGKSAGLIGHSIAGSMAVEVAARLGEKIAGVFSIEGNLTPDDAMFTGKASDFDDPDEFKKCFLNDIWKMGQSSEALRHYYAGARMGDPQTMWHLGRDARRVSEGNRLGEAFRDLSRPAMYYWSKASTPTATQEWIGQSCIANEVYIDAGHWPMVEQPIATARSIGDFFDGVGT
ncbi:MAG: alpha/beta fold hydrolase [Aestuariivirgaceae bacterium]